MKEFQLDLYQLNPGHQVMKEYQLGPLPVPPPTSFDATKRNWNCTKLSSFSHELLLMGFDDQGVVLTMRTMRRFSRRRLLAARRWFAKNGPRDN
jgi:hypothetical protein